MMESDLATNLRSSDDEDWISVKKPDDAMDKSKSTSASAQSAAIKHKEASSFKEKEFKIRNSLLTDLFQSSDIAVIYNLFFAILVLLMLNTIAKDALEQGSLNLDLWIIWWNFGRLPLVMTVWFAMFASTCTIVYPLFRWWAHLPSRKVDLISQAPWIGAYIAYIMAMFYFPLRFLFAFELPIASSFIITCENVRLLMKVHAFIRENVPRSTAFKLESAKYKKDDQRSTAPTSPFPSMDKLIYFIFCPSFIYRDEYPRTATCDWWVVCKYFLQCLGSIMYTGYIFTRFCIPIFEKVDYRTVTYPTMILSIFPSILPGAFCLLLLFWGLLHCWLNMFSEAMRFGDRQFYLDWWKSKSMASYYRNWNLVVHEWLYTYVYRDLSAMIPGKRGRKIAQLTVFFLSAAVHEYWFGVAFRIFYPVMFALYFICGGTFFFISRLVKMDQAWNVVMWFNLMIGNGMFVALYSMEWYARQRCAPSFESELLDVLVPRSWMCK